MKLTYILKYITRVVSDMDYNKKGMRKLSFDDVKKRVARGEITGCYFLYSDGTESVIDEGNGWSEIMQHIDNGGEIGEEIGEEIDCFKTWLPDGKEIDVPVVVDISELGCLDELEYSMWNVIQEYMAQFGIKTKDDEPDWATVKAVQDSLLKVFIDAGVNFRMFQDEKQEKINEVLGEAKDKQELKVSLDVDVTSEDIDDIICVALEGGINYWCDEAKVEGEYLGKYASEQIGRGGRLILQDCEEKKKYILDREKLMNGIKRYVEDPDKPYDILCRQDNTVGCHKGYALDCCMVDAVVADMIIQYSLFGEIVFG